MTASRYCVQEGLRLPEVFRNAGKFCAHESSAEYTCSSGCTVSSECVRRLPECPGTPSVVPQFARLWLLRQHQRRIVRILNLVASQCIVYELLHTVMFICTKMCSPLWARYWSFGCSFTGGWFDRWGSSRYTAALAPSMPISMTKMVHLKATPSFREYTSPCTFHKFQIGKYIFASHHEMTKIMRTACKNKTVSITKVVNRILHKNISHVSNLSNHESRKYACALDHEWPNANWINGSSWKLWLQVTGVFFKEQVSPWARRVTVLTKSWQRCPRGRPTYIDAAVGLVPLHRKRFA